MKKVIIADDNLMVVEALDRLIKWEEYGFTVVAKASDGAEALEAIKKFGVDIIINDIKMPIMDGLTLIREIRTLGMDCKAIVLSSYNDFQLVREAMRLGASEYILKSELDPSSLTGLLCALAEQLDQERDITRRVNMWESDTDSNFTRQAEFHNELYLNRRYIKDQMFRELCLGYLSEEQFLARKKEYLNIRFLPGCHEVLYLSVDYFQKLLEMRWYGNETLLSFAILNVMGEILDSIEGVDLFYNGSGDFVIIRTISDEKWLSVSAWSTLFESLSQALDKYLRVRISGGLISNRYSMLAIPALYMDAMKVCQFRFILGKGKLITEQDIQQSVGETVSFKNSHDRVGLLRNALSVFHPQLLERTLSSLYVKQEETRPGNFNEVLRLYEKYSFVLMDFIEQNGLKTVCGPLLDSFNEFIYDREAIPELNRRLKDIISRIAQSMETGNSHVRQLVKYIQGHYEQEITLQLTAEQLGVSGPYLGKLMQKELNISFNDYLNHYRIERAKEFLVEGKLKIYEVAEHVGYASTEYFSRIFKKVVGVTPKDFSSGKYT
ncbi:response regulator [Paenibacillus sp. Soil787]|uniref:response regulator n=1 Tax=Paenibacillus sp. Soil787 TaxID=1736411 RepID=UPI000703B8E0|nr:response regulator [Paenibacillus sp. Soil787]KRF09947.1 hypothetical protein ASG93_19165 [Paenibacillus sp. Soil787]